MMLLLQSKDFVYPLFELVDIFILSFPHCLIPMVGFFLD